MKLRIGYELVYKFPQPTPIILVVNVHETRVNDLVEPDRLQAEPSVEISSYHDGFGNHCTRLLAPEGVLRLSASGLIQDSGLPDAISAEAWQDDVPDLPEENLVFLLGSRYCETDLLSNTAWQLFYGIAPGYARAKAICDFVHHHLTFNYGNARPTRSAAQAYEERSGVCRDFAHLAIAFCRCMNMPARYCTGYLSDIGTPLPHPPGDFAAWIEVWIGGRWHMFDPRNNVPRIGRVLMARGRDASDVAIATTFGPNQLDSFKVLTEKISEVAAN